MRELEGDEFSVYGVSRDSGEIIVMDVQEGVVADRDGVLPGDLIQSINGRPVKSVEEMI